MDFATIWTYLPFLLKAALMTIAISFVSLVLGSLLGLGLTLLRVSPNRMLKVLVWIYVWLIRGTPMLLQIFVIYYWLPSYGIMLPPIVAGIVALSVNSAGYYVDIFRSAIQAVPVGQVEAGYALGMRPSQVMRRIVLPLSVRPALPPYIGQSINLVKNSSLVSVISVQELMFTSQAIYSSTFRVAEILGTAGIIYLLINTVLQVLQTDMERRLSYYTVR